MPLYPIRCACGFVGDVMSKVRELGPDGSVRCECGRWAEQDYSRKVVQHLNRTFHGEKSVSITEGWHPDEVDRVQREMVQDGYVDAANCVRKDGSVVFPDRQTQQKYMQAKARIWKRVSEGPSEADSWEDLAMQEAAKANGIIAPDAEPEPEKKPKKRPRRRPAKNRGK